MPLGSNKDLYKVKDSRDTIEVNQVLQRIAEALDELKGLRGTVAIAAGMTMAGNVTVTGNLTVIGEVRAGGDETQT